MFVWNIAAWRFLEPGGREGNFFFLNLKFNYKLVKNKNLHINFFFKFFANKILLTGGISMRREVIPSKQFYFGLMLYIYLYLPLDLDVPCHLPHTACLQSLCRVWRYIYLEGKHSFFCPRTKVLLNPGVL